MLPAQDRMPFVGPKKGAVLQRLVRDRAPKLAVEVGTLCGYSALLIAKAMAPGARLVTLESDWKWALVAKRFVWQATQGDKLKPVRRCHLMHAVIVARHTAWRYTSLGITCRTRVASSGSACEVQECIDMG